VDNYFNALNEGTGLLQSRVRRRSHILKELLWSKVLCHSKRMCSCEGPHVTL